MINLQVAWAVAPFQRDNHLFHGWKAQLFFLFLFFFFFLIKALIGSRLNALADGHYCAASEHWWLERKTHHHDFPWDTASTAKTIWPVGPWLTNQYLSLYNVLTGIIRRTASSVLVKVCSQSLIVTLWHWLKSDLSK